MCGSHGFLVLISGRMSRTKVTVKRVFICSKLFGDRVKSCADSEEISLSLDVARS